MFAKATSVMSATLGNFSSLFLPSLSLPLSLPSSESHSSYFTRFLCPPVLPSRVRASSTRSSPASTDYPDLHRYPQCERIITQRPRIIGVLIKRPRGVIERGPARIEVSGATSLIITRVKFARFRKPRASRATYRAFHNSPLTIGSSIVNTTMQRIVFSLIIYFNGEHCSCWHISRTIIENKLLAPGSSSFSEDHFSRFRLCFLPRLVTQ